MRATGGKKVRRAHAAGQHEVDAGAAEVLGRVECNGAVEGGQDVLVAVDLAQADVLRADAREVAQHVLLDLQRAQKSN
jgi:hypothetical protein